MKKWRREAWSLILRALILLFHFKHEWYQFNKKTQMEKCVVCEIHRCEVDNSHEWHHEKVPFCIWCQFDNRTEVNK